MIASECAFRNESKMSHWPRISVARASNRSSTHLYQRNKVGYQRTRDGHVARIDALNNASLTPLHDPDQSAQQLHHRQLL